MGLYQCGASLATKIGSVGKVVVLEDKGEVGILVGCELVKLLMQVLAAQELGSG